MPLLSVYRCIGKNWNEASSAGTPRLNDQRDHLRIEIETALECRIPVIPVLVDGVEMPSEGETAADACTAGVQKWNPGPA